MQKLNKYISCLLDDTTPTTGLGTFSSPPQLSPVLTVLVDTLGLLLGTALPLLQFFVIKKNDEKN